jgi:hypothetical protein
MTDEEEIDFDDEGDDEVIDIEADGDDIDDEEGGTEECTKVDGAISGKGCCGGAN